MSAYEEKIAGMLSQKQITPEEAAELLQAAKTTEGRSPWQWLLAPATRMSTSKALAFTCTIALLSIGLAKLLKVRFDGALDVHLGTEAVPWGVVALDVLAYLPLTVGAFYAVSLVFGSRGRFVDFFVGVGVARIAMLLQALAAALFLPMPQKDQPLPPTSAGVLFATVLVLPLLVWGMAMLFFHFREASGLRRGRLAFGFIVAVIAAEVVSKLFLSII